jgi:hypothetical protein
MGNMSREEGSMDTAAGPTQKNASMITSVDFIRAVN